MNNKTTAILTFLVSTVIPFIQEVVDFFSAFRTGSYSSEASAALRSVAFDVEQDLSAAADKKKSIDDYVQPLSTAKEKSLKVDKEDKRWSRFLQNNR